MANPYRRPFLGSTHRWQIKLWLGRNPWFGVLMLALLLSILTYLVQDKYFSQELPVAPVVECNGDVKECIDGTEVGRIGPDCKFAECPKIEPEDTKPDDIVNELPDIVDEETLTETINETESEQNSELIENETTD